MILHAIVSDAGTAAWAARHGASVVQLRLKDVPTALRVQVGRQVMAGVEGRAMIVLNDDLEAAAELGVAVHLGQDDPGVASARRAGIPFGRSAGSLEEARAAEAEGALYVGAGPVWETPSKADAGPSMGLGGLGAICAGVGIPVVAIGGVNLTNAAACITAGAAGVAVIRAVTVLPRLRAALDAALEAAGTAGRGR